MQRYYFSPVTGDGLSTATGFKPTVAAALSTWGAVDGRANRAAASTGAGMLVISDVTAAEHTAALAITGVVYIPFEDASGNALPLTATIGDVPSAKRTEINTKLEAWHIPTQGWTTATPLSAVVRRLVRRLLLRAVLGSDDWTEGLDTLVSAIPAAKRTTIATKLQAAGFDTSGIFGTDTVRESIRKLGEQDVIMFRGGLAA